MYAGLSAVALFAGWQMDGCYRNIPGVAWHGVFSPESWLAVLVFPVLLFLPVCLYYLYLCYRNGRTRSAYFDRVVVDNIEDSDFYYGRSGFPVPEGVKRAVYQRDGGRCHYCRCFTVRSTGLDTAENILSYLAVVGKLLWLAVTKNGLRPVRQFEADHIVPEKFGGDGRRQDFVVTSCRRCNRRKHDKIAPPFDMAVLKFLYDNNLTIHRGCLE